MTCQDTSRVAYENTPNRREQILGVIQERSKLSHDPYGATDWEIHEEIGCPYTSVQRDRGLLVKTGLVRDSGARRNTPNNRPAIVWEAA